MWHNNKSDLWGFKFYFSVKRCPSWHRWGSTTPCRVAVSEAAVAGVVAVGAAAVAVDHVAVGAVLVTESVLSAAEGETASPGKGRSTRGLETLAGLESFNFIIYLNAFSMIFQNWRIFIYDTLSYWTAVLLYIIPPSRSTCDSFYGFTSIFGISERYKNSERRKFSKG